MESEGTTYGFTLSVSFQIALCICVIGCLTWQGTILQMGSEIRFQTWFGLAIHRAQHALLLWQHCSDCFCLLHCVICCLGGIKPPWGGFITPEGVVLFPKRGGCIPPKGWFYLFKKCIKQPPIGA